MRKIENRYIDISVLKGIQKRFLSIFTNKERNPNAEANFYWSTYLENAKGIKDLVDDFSGFTSFCSKCSDCQDKSHIVAEYFSLYQALRWVEDNEPLLPISAYVSAGFYEFESARLQNPELLKTNGDKCQLKALAEQIERLEEKLYVEIVEYSDAN